MLRTPVRQATRLALAITLGLSPSLLSAQAMAGEPRALVAANALPPSIEPAIVAAETGGDTIELQLADMAPGTFVWAPERAASGAVTVLVSVPAQMAYVYRGATLIGASTVSTGKPGHDTPTGTFPILQKKVDHKSNLYDSAPMPFMQRLTWDGVALHAGRIPGHPASHGCVRLPRAFARSLYGATTLGATVVVTDEMPLSPGDGYQLVSAAARDLATGASLAMTSTAP